jgi:hypothetical protein
MRSRPRKVSPRLLLSNSMTSLYLPTFPKLPTVQMSAVALLIYFYIFFFNVAIHGFGSRHFGLNVDDPDRSPVKFS